MILLHISNINLSPSSGMSVVIPQHILHQSKLVQVGFVNISNVCVSGINNQFVYRRPFKLDNLPFKFQRPSLVVFHGCYFIEYVSIYEELRKHNVPYVIVPHGSFTVESQKKKRVKKLLFNVFFLKKFVKNASGIQYLSHGELNKTAFKHGNPFVAPNGIDEHGATIPMSNSEIIVTYIGRLDVFYKGIDLLCEASRIEKIFLVNHKVKINLYGPNQDGGHRVINQLISKWEVSDIIKLYEGVFDGEKVDILLKSSYFIQTSRSEGLPMGILEALSYGVPCIITVGTNLSKIVEQYNAGWVCKTNAEDIASVLKKAIEERNQLSLKSKCAKKLIHENFAWEVVSRDAIERYREIVNS